MTNASIARRPIKAAVLAATVFALATAGRADALCLDNLLQVPGKAPAPANAVPAAHVAPAVYTTAHATPSFAIRNVSQDDQGDEPSIVGLWEFRLNGNVPPDFGTQAWHSDGTELMFSAGRNPAAGDVCQGVWKKIGRRTYSLNHIAMGWDFGSFGLRVHIRAVVTLSPSGDSYTGTFTAGLFNVTPDNPFDESNMLGSGSGAMTGTRVKP